MARMQLSPEATEVHVAEALRLFNVSTMDAANSGVGKEIFMTEETKAELQQVEAQVKRRVGIGSRMSVRSLIDQIGRMGMSEDMVRRALHFMSQRDEVEFVRERRVIVRKA